MPAFQSGERSSVVCDSSTKWAIRSGCPRKMGRTLVLNAILSERPISYITTESLVALSPEELHWL